MPKQVVAIFTGLAVGFAISFGLSYALSAAGAEPVSSPWIIGAVVGTATMTAMSNLGGNRKVALADREARAEALAFAPPPGMALLIVYREGIVAKAVGVDIAIDGRDVAQLKSPRFTALALPPGRHSLRAALAGAMNAASGSGEAAFDLAAGATAVLRITLKMKLTTSDIVLTRIDDLAAAKARLSGMKMIAPEIRPQTVT